MLGAARPVGVHLRAADGDRCSARAARPEPAAAAGEHLRLRGRRAHGARDPARLAGADRRPVERRSRRGSSTRSSRPRTSASTSTAASTCAGSSRAAWNDYATARCRAARRSRSSSSRTRSTATQPTIGPQAARGGARLAARAEVDEGKDPDRLPEHDLLRQRRLRRRAGVPGLLRPRREDDVNPAEAALLAGIPEDPSLYDPVAHPKPRVRAATSCSGRCSTRAYLDRGAVPRAALQGADAEPGGVGCRRPRGRPRRTSPTTSPTSSCSSTRPRGVYGGGLRVTHDDRPRAAEARARRDREGAAAVDRPDGRARDDRRAHRRGARDGRRPQLPPEPVQPRDAGRAAAGVVVQAVRARGGAARRGSRRRRRSSRSRSRSTPAGGSGTSTTTRASISGRST